MAAVGVPVGAVMVLRRVANQVLRRGSQVRHERKLQGPDHSAEGSLPTPHWNKRSPMNVMAILSANLGALTASEDEPRNGPTTVLTVVKMLYLLFFGITLT